MIEKSNIVKEFKVANVKVKVCDDYFKEKTASDIDKSLRYIAQMLGDYDKEEYYN